MKSTLYNEYIYLIKDKVSLLDIVSKRITVHNKGNYYVALCPFHNEKTPSFHIKDNEGYFHCFGCGKTGDIFQFLIDYERYSFKEALIYLAEIAGITIKPNFNNTVPQRSNINYNKLLHDVAEWSYNQLLSKQYNFVLQYLLEKRKLSNYTIKTFQLGYMPNNFDSLNNYLIAKGYTKENIVSAGLQYKDNISSNYLFKNRVLFPIKNKIGKIIGFGGRTINDVSYSPKYLNSADSALFHKKLNLYGLHEALKIIKGKGYIILVEGYLDVIMLHQNGFPAVSTLGTAVSKEQIELLINLKVPLYICLDNDEAGIKATLKVIDILLTTMNEDTQPKLIQLPNNDDPDSFLRKHSSTEFNKLIETAIPLSQYLWNITVTDNENYFPELLASLHKTFHSICAKITNHTLKHEFAKYFKGKINSLNPYFQNLYVKKSNFNHVNLIKEKQNKAILQKSVPILHQKWILSYIISCPDIYYNVVDNFSMIEFSKDLEKIKQFIVSLLEQDNLTKDDLVKKLEISEFNTILSTVMNDNKVLMELQRLKEKQDFLNAFNKVWDLLIYRNINQDIQSLLNKSVSKSENFKDEANKITNHMNILLNEKKQTTILED